MFKCEICQETSSAGEAQIKVPVEFAMADHPERDFAHGKMVKANWGDWVRPRRDPGGMGTRIVREINVAETHETCIRAANVRKDRALATAQGRTVPLTSSAQVRRENASRFVRNGALDGEFDGLRATDTGRKVNLG